MQRITRAFAPVLLLLSSCSFVIDIAECEDNADCIFEDGTRLVCGVQSTCVEPPELGDDCTLARECLDPLICVAADPDQDVGFCTLDCTLQACEGSDVPADWVCCDLDNGMSACLSPMLCG